MIKEVVLFLRGKGYRERQYLMGSFTTCQVLYILSVAEIKHQQGVLVIKSIVDKLNSLNSAEEKILAST